MSERSSRPNWIVAVIGCGTATLSCRGVTKPQADPSAVKAAAAQVAKNSPVPAAVPACSGPELTAPVTMTFRTLQLLAGHTLNPNTNETRDWVNPTALDSTAAQTLVNANAGTTEKRQAAAELLSASSWIVYRVDLVNAPMALGVKELKTGTLTGRVIRYERQSGRPTCATLWAVQNSREKTDWAISASNKPYIDPAVANILREDLATQYLAHVQRGAPNAKP